MGTEEATGMCAPSFCFAGPVHILTMHATTGMNTFFCGFPVSTAEHISVTCGCSIPGAGACLMDSGGSRQTQNPRAGAHQAASVGCVSSCFFAENLS